MRDPGFRLTREGKALWILAFLAPVIGEMLSGSAPFVEWLNPLVVAVFLGMYGAGAILVRELTIVWGKGWATVLVLGAAYGIIEEGIAVKSFFDPAWVDLGELAYYGRYLGVNWVWSIWLTVYHSMVSIALTLLVFELAFPRFRRRRLLTDRRLKVVGSVFVIDIALSAVGFVYIQDYLPPVGWYLACFVVVAGLALLAKALPRDLLIARNPFPVWPNGKFFVLGFLAFPALFITAGAAPDQLHPIFPIMILVGLCAGLLLMLRHRMGAQANDEPKAYFAAGLLAFLASLNILLELGGAVSSSIAGILFIAIIPLLIHRVKSYAEPNRVPGVLESWMAKRRRTVSNR